MPIPRRPPPPFPSFPTFPHFLRSVEEWARVEELKKGPKISGTEVQSPLDMYWSTPDYRDQLCAEMRQQYPAEAGLHDRARKAEAEAPYRNAWIALEYCETEDIPRLMRLAAIHSFLHNRHFEYGILLAVWSFIFEISILSSE